jgi:ribosomal protein L11 methyltransferase
MQYIQVTFSFVSIQEYQKDLLINELAEIGFNTFEDTENGFSAFIDHDSYSQYNLTDALIQFEDEFEYAYTVTEIAAENWNEEWEKNFEPLIIDERCYVRATFHSPQPQYAYEIVIDPKMAFGTGHHQTTTMMMRYILDADVSGKLVLDMGAGTGILAILAAKKGARELVAIDNDEVCYLSAMENSALNDIGTITTLWGGREVIPEREFDIILANINRNILLDQIPIYARVLKNGGDIYFSGFYESPDLEMITDACKALDINYCDHQKIGDWVAAHFKKFK